MVEGRVANQKIQVLLDVIEEPENLSDETGITKFNLNQVVRMIRELEQDERNSKVVQQLYKGLHAALNDGCIQYFPVVGGLGATIYLMTTEQTITGYGVSRYAAEQDLMYRLVDQLEY